MAEEVKTETVEEEPKTTETVVEEPVTEPHTETVSPEEQIKRMEAALKKANSEAAKSRKQLEALEKAEQERKDAELSETERLKKRLAEIEAEAANLKRTELQRQAAEKAGLPASLATRLQGETLEELETDAKALAETLPKKQAPPLLTTNPGGNADGNGETDEQRRRRLLG